VAILITGGAGYVGRWLAHELAAPAGQRPGDDVVALDLRAPDPAARPPLPPTARFIEGDVTDRAALGEPYEIDVDPEAGLPVCYAKDAARALAALATADAVARPIYNVSTGSTTARELIAIVSRRIPRTRLSFKPDPQLAPVSRISRDWRVSVAAAGRELGWRPAYSIETMVHDLIAIVRNNGG